MQPAAKRLQYFREKLETPLQKLGYRGGDLEALLKEFNRILSHVAFETVIPDKFFDIESGIVAIAKKTEKDPYFVHQKLIRYVPTLFELHNIRFVKPPEPFTPSKMAMNTDLTSKNTNSGSPALTSIFDQPKIKPERKKPSLFDYFPKVNQPNGASNPPEVKATNMNGVDKKAKAEAPEEKTEVKAPPKKAIRRNHFIVPDYELIAQAAWLYKRTHGRLPHGVSGREFLPPNSYTWSNLTIHYLKNENSLKAIMERYPYKSRPDEKNLAEAVIIPPVTIRVTQAQHLPIISSEDVKSSLPDITLEDLAARHPLEYDVHIDVRESPSPHEEKVPITFESTTISNDDLAQVVKLLEQLPNKQLAILAVMRLRPQITATEAMNHAESFCDKIIISTIMETYPEGILQRQFEKCSNILNKKIREKLIDLITKPLDSESKGLGYNAPSLQKS